MRLPGIVLEENISLINLLVLEVDLFPSWNVSKGTVPPLKFIGVDIVLCPSLILLEETVTVLVSLCGTISRQLQELCSCCSELFQRLYAMFQINSHFTNIALGICAPYNTKCHIKQVFNNMEDFICKL